MKNVLMIMSLIALSLPALARAQCLDNPNALYTLFPVYDSSDPFPQIVPLDGIVITGKRPAVETERSIAGSGQMYCHQKNAGGTWVEDTNFPADKTIVERSIVRVQRSTAADHSTAYFRTDLVPPINGKYKFGEIIMTNPYQGYYTCQDNTGNWYWKGCMCRNETCSI